MIRFQTIDVMMPNIEQAKVKSWIESVIEANGKRVGELYYYFCSDDKLLEINNQRLGQGSLQKGLQALYRLQQSRHLRRTGASASSDTHSLQTYKGLFCPLP